MNGERRENEEAERVKVNENGKSADTIPHALPLCENVGRIVGVSAQAKTQQTKKRRPDDFRARDCKQEATITEIIEPAPSQKIQ
jgi:hypothetical protein